MIYEIYTPQDLANMANDMSGEYELMNDIDLSEWGNWTPIGSEAEGFEGILRGNGYCIKNLTITNWEYYLGLFGELHYATVENVEIRDMSIELPEYVNNTRAGGIAGYSINSSILNCKVSGTISNVWICGGIVGGAEYSDFFKCETNVSLSCSGSAGGILAHEVFCTYNQCFADGEITSDGAVGGLIGGLYYGQVTNCYSRASVSSPWAAGGLIGEASYTATILYCYAAGSVDSSGDYAGGFIGLDDISSGNAVIRNNYYDSETTGMSDTKGAAPKSTEEMMKKATFENWDFKRVWVIDEGVTYPQFVIGKRTQCESISMTRLLV